MRKNIKKIVAGILSATMLLSTSAIAFADNLTSGGTNSNSSKVEGFVSTDVFKVVVPTSVAADTFKFIIDPQQLIAKTNAGAYADLNSGAFESGATVFFMNSGAGNLMSDAAGTGTYTYSHYSNKLTVTNKSTMAVNVNLSATITSAGNLTFANSSTFGENDTAAKVYLGIKKVGDDTSTAITAAGGTSTSLLSGAPDDAYDYFYSDATKKYSYDLTAAAKDADYEGFAEMKFYVEGAANPNGDFSAVTSATPVLNMTWTVTPSASGVQGTAVVLPYNNDVYLALRNGENEEFSENATSLIVNGKDVTENTSLIGGYVAVSATDLIAAGVTMVPGETTLKAVYVVDGTTYNASYAIPAE